MQNPANELLAWYDANHRDLPWRVPPAAAARGVRADPYHVWLSEVMLQQTLVEAVKPYFARFLAQWPDVGTLAAADRDEVMKAWAGLGYYSRARNLKKCAEIVAGDHDGVFPETAAELRKLPGIGDYTAAAIAAIAFGRAVAVVDGNVERVISRFAAIDTPLPAAKAAIREFVSAILPADRPGDFAQALMDLGATICTPRRPSCLVCPLRDGCEAFAESNPERFPVKAARKAKPLRRGAAFVARRGDGAVWLRRRPESGLLGGMAEVPTTGWTSRCDGATGPEAAPVAADWRSKGAIRHVFTHFELELSVYGATITEMGPGAQGWWSTPDDLPGEALPTVMKKVIETALPGATKPTRQQGETV